MGRRRLWQQHRRSLDQKPGGDRQLPNRANQERDLVDDLPVRGEDDGRDIVCTEGSI